MKQRIKLEITINNFESWKKSGNYMGAIENIVTKIVILNAIEGENYHAAFLDKLI